MPILASLFILFHSFSVTLFHLLAILHTLKKPWAHDACWKISLLLQLNKLNQARQVSSILPFICVSYFLSFYFTMILSSVLLYLSFHTSSCSITFVVSLSVLWFIICCFLYYFVYSCLSIVYFMYFVCCIILKKHIVVIFASSHSLFLIPNCFILLHFEARIYWKHPLHLSR